MRSNFMWCDAEFVGAKNGDAVAECVGDFFAGHVVGFSVVQNGGDICVVVGFGVGTDTLYERGPLLDGAKGVVVSRPLGVLGLSAATISCEESGTDAPLKWKVILPKVRHFVFLSFTFGMRRYSQERHVKKSAPTMSWVMVHWRCVFSAIAEITHSGMAF